MKQHHILFILCIAVANCLSAQTDSTTAVKAWKFDGNIGLNATGTGLINWTGGGKNTVSGLAFVRLHLLYDKDNVAWESDFDTDFGVSWTDQSEEQLRKTSDKIKLSSKLGWEFRNGFFLTGLAAFQSQCLAGRDIKKGYDPPVSFFLAPSDTDIRNRYRLEKGSQRLQFLRFRIARGGTYNHGIHKRQMEQLLQRRTFGDATR